MRLFQAMLGIGFFALPLFCHAQSQSNSGEDHTCLKEYQLNNFEKAMAVCLPAAKLNNPEAQYVIGMLYKRGKVVQRSEITAMQWLTQAADNGYAAAQLKLGKMLSTTTHPDYTKAFEYFLSAAQSLFEAQFLVAICYQNGLGVSNNPTLALEWYNNAIANGLDAPPINIAQIPQSKLKIATKKTAPLQQISDGYIQLKKAAEHGYPHAQFEIAKYYLNGQDVEQDDAMALNYFKAAATHGIPGAKSYLAWMNALGLGEPPNLPEAIYWFISYFDDELVQKPVAILPPTSEKEAKDQAKLLYDQALKLLQDNEMENQKQGFALLSHAANSNFASAQVTLAKAYQTGKWVKQNATQAAKWYEKAAHHDNSEAQYALGWLYFNGEGVPKDLALSYYWFEKAAVEGGANAKSAKMFVQSHLSSNEKPSKNLIQAYMDLIPTQPPKKLIKNPSKPSSLKPNKDRLAGR